MGCGLGFVRTSSVKQHVKIRGESPDKQLPLMAVHLCALTKYADFRTSPIYIGVALLNLPSPFPSLRFLDILDSTV